MTRVVKSKTNKTDETIPAIQANRPLFPRLLIATRPWSFPAALSPLLITFTILYLTSNRSICKAVIFSFGMVALQGGANLLNSFCDFENGLDKSETAGDRTIVDELVTRSELPFLFTSVAAVWFISFLSTLPVASAVLQQYLTVYVIGVALAVLYSAGSASLKYVGFGDLVVFLAFGPLLVVAASWACAKDPSVVPLARILFSTAPAAILVVAILHANNHRDLKVDARNHAKTVSVRLGERLSLVYYNFLVLAPPVLSVITPLLVDKTNGLLAGILVLPLSMRLCKLVRQATVPRDIDAETAKVMLIYGIMASVGISIVGI